MANRVLVVNGPNLNLLGTREPHFYGKTTLAELEAACVAHGKTLGLTVECVQSNHEGVLIDAIHAARGKAKAIVVNAGALSHTSIAIRDALSGADLPVFEVHLSNIYARESFRHHSNISAIAKSVVCGLGPRGYLASLDAIAELP